METNLIKLSKVRVNDKNPRTITEDKLRRLVESILVFPKMLTIRPIVIDDKGVALGGIVSKEIPRDVYEKAFPWFIRTAHEHGAKIHGLGYTSIEGVHKYHFDSVDSTAWLYGNRGGYLYKFNPSTGNLDKYKKSGRLKSREGAMFNFREWVKFLKYADKNL